MISLTCEELLPMRAIPGRLPARANGRRVHVSACYRWAMHGCRGVLLETICVGGTTYTSVEALQRFAVGLSRRSAKPPTPRRGRAERATCLVRMELGIADPITQPAP
jgi:hypothetical protein